MFRRLSPVQPKSKGLGIPEWFHMHGNKIRVREADPAKPLLVLASNSVEVRIHPHVGQGWDLEYEIRQPDGPPTKGTFWMCTRDFRAAFRMSDECHETWGAPVILQYGGHVAHEDKYIRFEKYLNIPRPGTGDDGDPNVSIWVDDGIQASVECFFNEVNERLLCAK